MSKRLLVRAPPAAPYNETETFLGHERSSRSSSCASLVTTLRLTSLSTLFHLVTIAISSCRWPLIVILWNALQALFALCRLIATFSYPLWSTLRVVLLNVTFFFRMMLSTVQRATCYMRLLIYLIIGSDFCHL